MSDMDWFSKRWVGGAVLVLVAIAGLFFASASDGGAGYVAGLVLFAICILVIFSLIGSAWGGRPLTARVDPLPANGTVRWVAAGVAVIVAIAGLFHASAAPAGSVSYGEGLALFLAATAYDFLLLKDWFDRRGA